MHVKLRDGIALTNQPKELTLSCRQRGIRHHVEQPNVQLANILMQRSIQRRDRFAIAAQAFEGR